MAERLTNDPHNEYTNPFGQFALGSLCGELDNFMDGPGPLRVAFDGVLWQVRAGRPRIVPDETLTGVELAVLRRIDDPNIMRAEVTHPEALLLARFEYTRQGGFSLSSEDDGLRYPGNTANFVMMRALVQETVADPISTLARADHITANYELANPHVEMPSAIHQQREFNQLIQDAGPFHF